MNCFSDYDQMFIYLINVQYIVIQVPFVKDLEVAKTLQSQNDVTANADGHDRTHFHRHFPYVFFIVYCVYIQIVGADWWGRV